jgi:hypothetical protein
MACCHQTFNIPTDSTVNNLSAIGNYVPNYTVQGGLQSLKGSPCMKNWWNLLKNLCHAPRCRTTYLLALTSYEGHHDFLALPQSRPLNTAQKIGPNDAVVIHLLTSLCRHNHLDQTGS